jgi:cytochrome c553
MHSLNGAIPMKFVSLFVAAAAAWLVAGCAGVERSRNPSDPQVSGATLAQQVCSNCHGLSGTSVSPNFPNLAGQTQPYLAAQLAAFRRPGRNDPAGHEYMWGLSRNLTDEQIDGLAAYFSSQKPALQPPEGDGARLSAGKAIFEAGLDEKEVPACHTCHGDKAQGMAIFPRLAGQHADYMFKQLMVFQRTDERPGGAAMKVVSHGLSEQDMADVTAYLQTLP